MIRSQQRLRDAQIIAAHRAGSPVRLIAQRFDLGLTAVYRILQIGMVRDPPPLPVQPLVRPPPFYERLVPDAATRAEIAAAIREQPQALPYRGRIEF